jgi:hypothetical protein
MNITLCKLRSYGGSAALPNLGRADSFGNGTYCQQFAVNEKVMNVDVFYWRLDPRRFSDHRRPNIRRLWLFKIRQNK